MSEKVESTYAVSLWMLCTVSMYGFNRLATSVFPRPCALMLLQMAFSILCMTACWPTLHFGSRWDVFRWCLLMPFKVGSFLSGMASLHYASTSCVIFLRALAPVLACGFEIFYPKPLQVTSGMLVAMGVMLCAVSLYVLSAGHGHMMGVAWAILHTCCCTADQLIQRLLLSKHQRPVDISKTGATLLNNFLGIIPVITVAAFTREPAVAWLSVQTLSMEGYALILLSCMVGAAVSFTGVWAQSAVSATSFLLFANVSKFVIMLMEAAFLGAEYKSLQVYAALIVISSATTCSYALEREQSAVKKPSKSELGSAAASETTALLQRKV